jgi:hypothetical protein
MEMNTPPDDVKTIAADIAQQLDETNPIAIEQIERIVEHLGAEAAQAFLREALEVEAQGGMMLPDGSRRRTPGGVFFYIAKGRISHEVRGLIWPHLWPRRKPRKRKPKIKPLPWATCLELAPEAMQEPGEATTVKITLIGRPGRIVERENVVLTSMQSTKAPTLPRGLPQPPDEPTTYVVYIARKQWQRVAEAVQDPKDKLIVEGYPVFEKRLGAMAVFTTFVTTKNLQAAKRQTQQP